MKVYQMNELHDKIVYKFCKIIGQQELLTII